LHRLRERADYKDFEIISREMAEEQIQKAEKIMEMIHPFLKEKWEAVKE
jgi:HEPN domain-containing protein